MERDTNAPHIALGGESNAEFLDYRGAERASFFIRNGRGMAYVRRGMAFERPRPYRTTETARILTLILDEQGVPHVRFGVTTQRADHDEISNEGQRTLSLKAFVEAYCSDEAVARFACEAPQRPGAFGRALRGGLRRLLPANTRRSAFIASYPKAPAKTAVRDDERAGPLHNTA